jgi:pimeloyl-ACP methyl ester carboxylesterase
MKIQTIQSHDGITLKYGFSRVDGNQPWLTFIIPFGLQLQLALPFFKFFEDKYNIISWEARSILAEPGDMPLEQLLTVDNHVADLLTLLKTLNIEQTKLIGYCSGAGIALKAANSHPNKFSQLVLANGEYALFDDASCVTQFGHDVNSLLPLAAKDEKTAQFILNKMAFDKKDNLPDGVHLPFSKAHYLHRYAVNFLAYRACDFSDMATSINHEILVICGEKDQQTNVGSSSKMSQLLKNSQTYIDPQGDHYGTLRAESNTLAKIRDYLDGQN